MGSQESRTQLCNEQYRIATFALPGRSVLSNNCFPPNLWWTDAFVKCSKIKLIEMWGGSKHKYKLILKMYHQIQHTRSVPGSTCLSAPLPLGRGSQHSRPRVSGPGGGGELRAAGAWRAHLAQPIEEHVEVGQHGASGHLDDVVEGLTGVVSQPAVGVVEAGEHRLDQLL